MKAVVMAGGEGTRLRPVTANRPKPLVPVCNQPIMEHIVELLKRHGVNEIVATLYYLGDEIESHFGDGSDYGVCIQYTKEPVPLGTAGSVKLAENTLRDGAFIIISGDALTDCDLTDALRFHRAKGSLATLVLARVPNPLDYGVVIVDDDGRIARFLEKPSASEVFSDTVNTGMYILEPAVFDLIEAGKNTDWSADVFPKLLESGAPMFGYIMDGYWADVGSFEEYRKAQADLMAGAVDLPIEGDRVSEGVTFAKTADVDASVTIRQPVFVGRNVKIKRGAMIGPNAVIGDNCFIEERAVIEDSVLWDSVYVGPQCRINGAIVGSRCTIKRDSVVREEAVIGDRCLIDVGCLIRPRVKLWPDKIVERGSTVTMSLVWGNKWRGKLFRELGVTGLSNLEITPDFACRLAGAYGSILPARSRVVTSRDSTRSSRMIKRALISALLSAGCDVLDMQSIALPIARHYIRRSGAAGAMNVRKLPGNARVTLIEMFDAQGAYLSRAAERKVETMFFREDFKRTDPDDLGVIEYSDRAIESYQASFFEHLGATQGRRRLRVAVDFGYSPLATIYPAMLERMGVEAIALNAFNNNKMAPRTEDEIARHVGNLGQIVGNLGYDLGVLFLEDAERLIVVDARGQELSSNTLFAAMGTLVARAEPGAQIAMPVTAPSRLENALVDAGASVIRTKADVRSIVAASMVPGVTFGANDRGEFVFSTISAGFDAAFAFGRLLALLQATDASLAEIVSALPTFEVAYRALSVPWELKGTVMRYVSENARTGDKVELTDGVKLFDGDAWVLVLPDSAEPIVHLYSEAPEEAAAHALIEEHAQSIETLVRGRPMDL